MNLVLQRLRVLSWVFLSSATIFCFTRTSRADFMDMFSYRYIIDGHNAAPYGMLVLCALFLFSRRKELKEKISRPAIMGRDYLYIAAGLALIAAAMLLPDEADFVLLKLFIAAVGPFAVIFGRIAKTPLALLALFSVATMFPLLATDYIGTEYALATIAPLKALLIFQGLPVEINGQLISLLSGTGGPITVMVTAGCAGPATVGVFLGIFGLMSLDMPLPLKRALAVFAFGVAGTWLQNVIRLLIILEAGHYLGENALWTTHFWTIYGLFPAWYLIFALVYFKQAESKKSM